MSSIKNRVFSFKIEDVSFVEGQAMHDEPPQYISIDYYQDVKSVNIVGSNSVVRMSKTTLENILAALNSYDGVEL